MVQRKRPKIEVRESQFYIRKLSKAGGSRYLNVGTILPREWEWMRVSIVEIDNDTCILKLNKVS